MNRLADGSLATQEQRAEQFKTLHEKPGIFALPNPWDAGSAKLLTQLGFAALATTSAGLAFALGRPDGEGAVTRQEALDNARAIVDATNLPVTADLENGFGDSPEACAETIRLAADVGLVGASIEDVTGRADEPIYALALSVERVQAAVEAARSLAFPFVVTARADNFIRGRMDIDDTIHRLKAFAAVGADVLYAPGLKSCEEIAAVVDAVAPKPINVLMGMADVQFSLAELEALGVKMVSVGSAFARAAYGAFLQGAREIGAEGTFSFVQRASPFAEINTAMKSD